MTAPLVSTASELIDAWLLPVMTLLLLLLLLCSSSASYTKDDDSPTKAIGALSLLLLKKALAPSATITNPAEPAMSI